MLTNIFFIFQKWVENNLKIQICQSITKYILKKCSKNNIKNFTFIYYILK